MTMKVLVCLIALVATALMLLSLRQSRIAQVNRMSQVWTELEAHEQAWKRLRLALATAANPGTLRPAQATQVWSPAFNYTADAQPSE
jgi:cell division protein FtsL